MRKREREIRIEMYWEERNMHWEVRMIYILGKLEMAKVTYIIGRQDRGSISILMRNDMWHASL
jgi:hypothetical protein